MLFNLEAVEPWHTELCKCAAFSKSAAIFACRQCHQLAYDSQRETPHSRALSRAQANRIKLGGSPIMSDDFPDKPKGMHWHTYNRLCGEAEEALNRSWPPWLDQKLATGKSMSVIACSC
jgi:hypothetical protein